MKKKIGRHGKIFSSFKGVIKIFKKKPMIHNLNEDAFYKKAIFISNHSAASGPMLLSLYFPTFFVPWGAHPMTENYKNRWNYLYHVFYQKKIGYKKVKSFILATLLAVISKSLYSAMKLIPTYHDLRFSKTLKKSFGHLDQDESILIFPEDSDHGYLEVMNKFNLGFVALAKLYYQKRQVDLPIYPVYYHKRYHAMMIGKPIFFKEVLEEVETDEAIAQYYLNVVNNLGKQLLDKYKKAEL